MSKFKSPSVLTESLPSLDIWTNLDRVHFNKVDNQQTTDEIYKEDKTINLLLTTTINC